MSDFCKKCPRFVPQVKIREKLGFHDICCHNLGFLNHDDYGDLTFDKIVRKILADPVPPRAYISAYFSYTGGSECIYKMERELLNG